MSLSKQPARQALLALHLLHLVNIPDPNRPMRCLDLDLIARPLVFPQQVEIADGSRSGRSMGFQTRMAEQRAFAAHGSRLTSRI